MAKKYTQSQQVLPILRIPTGKGAEAALVVFQLAIYKSTYEGINYLLIKKGK